MKYMAGIAGRFAGVLQGYCRVQILVQGRATVDPQYPFSYYSPGRFTLLPYPLPPPSPAHGVTRAPSLHHSLLPPAPPPAGTTEIQVPQN